MVPTRRALSELRPGAGARRDVGLLDRCLRLQPRVRRAAGDRYSDHMDHRDLAQSVVGTRGSARRRSMRPDPDRVLSVLADPVAGVGFEFSAVRAGGREAPLTLQAPFLFSDSFSYSLMLIAEVDTCRR